MAMNVAGAGKYVFRGVALGFLPSFRLPKICRCIPVSPSECHFIVHYSIASRNNTRLPLLQYCPSSAPIGLRERERFQERPGRVEGMDVALSKAKLPYSCIPRHQLNYSLFHHVHYPQAPNTATCATTSHCIAVLEIAARALYMLEGSISDFPRP